MPIYKPQDLNHQVASLCVSLGMPGLKWPQGVAAGDTYPVANTLIFGAKGDHNHVNH